MFTVKKVGDNRIDIVLDGELDSIMMEVSLDELLLQSEGISNGKMLYTIVDFELPTLGALGVELSRLPSLFGLIKKFDKAAVLTDENWLKKASEFEGMLIPGLDIKAFDKNDKNKAEAWLNES
jgi:hypothetical protein